MMVAALVMGLQMGCTAPRAGAPASPGAVTGAARLDAPPTGDYRIQSGDRLTIRFFNNPEFSQDIRVRPDGKITLPYIDDVRVAGLTSAEVDAAITERFRKVLLRPEITIIVREFASQRVYVGGQVSKPGLIALTGQTTALQAIMSAGGFLDTARANQVLLIRKGRDNRHAGYALDLEHVLKAGQSGEDVRLQPLDVVYVPKTRIAKVNQFVDQYIRRLLPIPGSFGLSVP
ncbi:polysaccharide biosynthesis/export family protein [Candidatus Entotheonella palauensis]|nr:polysaccharide biosynthesis/export family protein [Candidatus Entotheonella palauensis]